MSGGLKQQARILDDVQRSRRAPLVPSDLALEAWDLSNRLTDQGFQSRDLGLLMIARDKIDALIGEASNG